MHAFDKIDTTILDVVKDNILSVFKSVSYQSIVETMQRKDLFTQLNSAEYLFGKARNIIDKYTVSTVGMVRITNLEEINKKYNRETGNEVVIAVAEYIKNSISDEYIFVRYMGPKFVIVFSGVDENGVVDFISDMKKEIEDLNIKVVKEIKEVKEVKEVKNETTKTKKKSVKQEKEEFVQPKLNFVLSKYYKGTALENVTKNLEEYIDNADKDESSINHI
jgi:diguanylate cyclase (GGDEF)-like protein